MLGHNFPTIHENIDHLKNVLPKVTANSRNVYTLIQKAEEWLCKEDHHK